MAKILTQVSINDNVENRRQAESLQALGLHFEFLLQTFQVSMNVPEAMILC